MGQWNRRYRPGRKNYNYQEPPPSPPRTQPLPYGRSENGVPAWEIDFCYVNGVTWHKVSIARKFMYCHETVLKWDDFAGEEAFHNAKMRYWERLNGLPCDDSSLDPDMYIGKVDWNSYIDPQLMSDLDREYCNPADEGKSEKSESNLKQASSCSLFQKDKNNEGENPWEPKSLTDPWKQFGADDENANKEDNPWEPKSLIDPWKQYAADEENAKKGDNPWESNLVQGIGKVKSFIDPWEQHCADDKFINKGENYWESNRVQGTEKLKSHVDPWEQYCLEVDQSISNNAWRDSVGESSLWNHGQSQNVHNSPRVRGNQHQQCAGYMQMKGQRYGSYNSWRNNERRNDFPVNASSNDRIRGDWGNNSERKKFSESPNENSRRLGFKEQYRERYDGCRKREGSTQHGSRNKSSRFQANDHGTAYQWRN